MRRRGHDVGNAATWRSSSRPSMRRSNSSAPLRVVALEQRRAGAETRSEPAVGGRQRNRRVQREVQLAVGFVAGRAQAADGARRPAVEVVFGDQAAVLGLWNEDVAAR